MAARIAGLTSHDHPVRGEVLSAGHMGSTDLVRRGSCSRARSE